MVQVQSICSITAALILEILVMINLHLRGAVLQLLNHRCEVEDTRRYAALRRRVGFHFRCHST